MLEEMLSKITSEASAERAFDHVAAISQFHRIQASPGYRKAAEYCVDRLLETSQDAQIMHYPAEHGVRFWQFPSFEEWSGKRGILKIRLNPLENRDRGIVWSGGDFFDFDLSVCVNHEISERSTCVHTDLYFFH